MNAPKLRFKEFNNNYLRLKYKDVLKIKSGKDQKQVECENGIYPILGTGGQIGKTNSFLYDKPSVLIGRKGTINKPQYMETPFWTVDTLFYSHIYEPNIPKYLFYSFQSVNWKKYDESTGVPSLSSSTIEGIDCNIPSKEEQLKVANFLSLLDKKIELQSKKIEDLKLFKLYIRNKIFSGIKTKDKIINTLNYEQPNRYIVKSDDYLNDENLIPVLTANKAFILGYCNEDDYYNKGDVIIFDDFTMDSKYVNFNFKIKSSAIKLLTQKNNNNLKYIFECLQALNLESTEHKRYYISIVQEIEIPVPDIIVQNKIANLMFTYDKKIKLESDNYNKLIELKKGLMQNMFV